MQKQETGVNEAYEAVQIDLLEAEINFLRAKVSALRESRQVLMGLLQQQMAAERHHINLLEQDIARLKKENLFYKKQTLQRRITS